MAYNHLRTYVFLKDLAFFAIIAENNFGSGKLNAQHLGSLADGKFYILDKLDEGGVSK